MKTACVVLKIVGLALAAVSAVCFLAGYWKGIFTNVSPTPTEVDDFDAWAQT